MDNYIGMTNLNGKNESTLDGQHADLLTLTSGGKEKDTNLSCVNGSNCDNGSGSGSKSCRCCRRAGSLLCSNIGLTLLILGYSALGAFVFSTLESMSERQRINQVIALRNLTVSKLWRITENTNILKEENWTAMTTNEIIKFQKLLYQAFREGYDGRETFNPQTDQWSFSGAFLYSLTVITTIGYGNIGPRTMEGKMLTIVYAILGIPLMILFLSKMGSMLANGLRCFYRSCCTCLPSSVGGKGSVGGGNVTHSSSEQCVGDSGDTGLDLGGTLVTVDGGLGGIAGLDQLMSVTGPGGGGTGQLSSPSGLLSHHGNHSHHHLHDHFHVHHISLNDIPASGQGGGVGGTNPASGHVALHCNSTVGSGANPNQTTGTLGIVCKGTGGNGTQCYGTGGGTGTCNAISISGSPGLVGSTNGLTLSPTVVSMGNSVGSLGIATITDSETKMCPETTEVPDHYTCQGILLNRHSHATLHTHPTSGHHHHHHHSQHHTDHINATTCSGDLHNDYQQYQQQQTDYQVNHQCCHHHHHSHPASNHHNQAQQVQHHNHHLQYNQQNDCGYSSHYFYPKTVPITLCCIIITGYVFLGASIFYLWEGWSYWESVYFCFASISTIGLGQATWILSDFRNSEKKLILCCIYILFGLALGAMVFNLLQDHLKRKLSTTSSSCGSSTVKKGKRGKRKSSTVGGGHSYQSHPHHHQNSQHSHLYSTTGDRELLTSTPAPNNPLLVEDDFDV